jgi:hypothetical protein
VPLRQFVHNEEAHVVGGIFIAQAGVSQTDYKIDPPSTKFLVTGKEVGIFPGF